MQATLGRLVIYTKRIPEMVEFYQRHFGYRARQLPGDRIVELCPAGAGMAILLHPAGKGQKEGQSLVKLVFDVPDVAAFCGVTARNGFDFGPIHQADGYCFANAKDPANNSISVSSRAFAVDGKSA